MCLQRLETLLQAQAVPYEMLTPEPDPAAAAPTPAMRGEVAGGTARQSAPRAGGKARISARDMAKILIVALDGRLAMVVLPATEALDLDRLKAATAAREARITNEDDYMVAFPDCEVGAIPPFGNLYDMPVYVAETLNEGQQLVFAAGTYRRLMRVSYRDFARLVQPTVAPLSVAEA